MADEAIDGQTDAEKDAALETIENILGYTPMKMLPAPGTTVEYRGQQFFTNGWDREYRKTVRVVPVDSEAGKQVATWLDAGSPTMTTAESAVMRDRVRDVEEGAPLYLLEKIAEPKEENCRRHSGQS